MRQNAFDDTRLATLRASLLAWYQHNQQDWPWRRLWRQHRSPYHVWISEIMLQQTVIKAALPAYERFLQKFPDVYALARASSDEVKLCCQGLGYYRRFGMMHRAAQQLAAAHPTPPMLWPDSAQAWLSLPGIGPNTSAAIASITLDEAAAVVDGNVERVLCRLLDIREAPNLPRLKPFFRQEANRLLAKEQPGAFNQAVMELGQRVCTPSSPRCQICPIACHCRSLAEGSQHLAPAAKIKKANVDVALAMIIVRQDGKIALYERSDAAKFLKGSLGFLTATPDGRRTLYMDDQKKRRALPRTTNLVGQVRHQITHHRLTIDVFETDYDQRWPEPKIWLAEAEIDQQLVASFDKKAWRLLQEATDTPLFKRPRETLRQTAPSEPVL